MKMWECRDLGQISEYLWMKIIRDKKQKKLIIDQIDYAKKIVEHFGQQNAKPTHTPLPVGYIPKANGCYVQCPSQLITDLDDGLIQVHNMTVSYKSNYVVERLTVKSCEIDCASQPTRSSVRRRQP